MSGLFVREMEPLWSPAEPAAISCKSIEPVNGESSQTGRPIVSRASAVACRPLLEVPSLRTKGSPCRRRKRDESLKPRARRIQEDPHTSSFRAFCRTNRRASDDHGLASVERASPMAYSTAASSDMARPASNAFSKSSSQRTVRIFSTVRSSCPRSNSSSTWPKSA